MSVSEFSKREAVVEWYGKKKKVYARKRGDSRLLLLDFIKTELELDPVGYCVEWYGNTELVVADVLKYRRVSDMGERQVKSFVKHNRRAIIANCFCLWLLAVSNISLNLFLYSKSLDRLITVDECFPNTKRLYRITDNFYPLYKSLGVVKMSTSIHYLPVFTTENDKTVDYVVDLFVQHVTGYCGETNMVNIGCSVEDRIRTCI